MTPFAIGLLGFGLLIIIIMLRFPVSLSMMILGFFGFAYLVNVKGALSMVALNAYNAFTNYSYTAAIMFIWMGYIASHSGLSKVMFNTINVFMGHIRGGLAMATTVACAAFGAICGSTMATTASMGSIAIPEMDKYKNDLGFSRGTVATAGILGTMIPPSIPLVVYGITTEQSISTLFIATVVPGLILMFAMCISIAVLTHFKPELAPLSPKATAREKTVALFNSGTFEVLFIFVFVLAGMFLGWFTPTESGAIGAACILIVTVIRRRLSFYAFWMSLKDAAKTSAMVFLLVLGANIFGSFIASSRVPVILSEWAGSLTIHPAFIMIILMLFQLFLGCIMDGVVVLVLSLPVVYPITVACGYDPIWLGPLMVLLAGIGMITPPVGLNAYIVYNIDVREPKVPIATVFKGIMPFLLTCVIVSIILIVFPDLTTFLPKLLGKY